MKKTLRKKFVFFAMSAVTILLVVLIGAINTLSYFILDRQSDDILLTIADGDERFLQKDSPAKGVFRPPMDMDTVKSARFFMVRVDAEGNVANVNVDRISSVTAAEAAQYAASVTSDRGKISDYKYTTKQLGSDSLIFFMDISGQTQTFVMVLSLSCAIAVVCWFAVLIFVALFSKRMVRPILAGMEKQKRFITNAGHELKTPLAIIGSNNDASALINGETKYSQNIRRQTQRLNVLMSNLLTLSKLDEATELPVENVNVSERVSELLLGYEDAMAQKNVVFSAAIEPGVVMRVHCDTFMQMISVLMDNAVKYTPENGSVRFLLASDGRQIKITEENTCEVPADPDAERLFERFYRGDSSRTQNGDTSGYGIGLSAARAIAENFGGTLRANYTDRGTLRFIARFRADT